MNENKMTGNSLYGAIIGDIVGSRFEFDNWRSKSFELFPGRQCYFTDDTVMTVAVMQALLKASVNTYEDLTEQTVASMQKLGRHYIDSGYGGRFLDWLLSPAPKPYNSWGNGAAMRISPVAYAAKDIEQVKELSQKVTQTTHNHPEGLKGAEAAALATYMALNKDRYTKEAICQAMSQYYNLDFTLEQIRDTYQFDESCQRTLPVALAAFFEAEGFEDTIRNAISIGGDSDTIAAIAGGIAGAYYGVPQELEKAAKTYLTPELLKTIEAFTAQYCQ